MKGEEAALASSKYLVASFKWWSALVIASMITLHSGTYGPDNA
jgi:hypothetical protein